MLEALFSGLISGATARKQIERGPSIFTRLQHTASAFIETETEKIQKSARAASAMLVLANATMLIAVIGFALVLVGIAFALEPAISLGGGFAVSGALAILLAAIGAITLKMRMDSAMSDD